MVMDILALVSLGLMIGGIIYGVISIYRYFIKKNITLFPVILGGSIFLVGVWLTFIVGLLENNQQDTASDSGQGSIVVNTEEMENVEEDESLSENEESDNGENNIEPTLEEFMREVKAKDPLSNYKDYMESYELEINRGYSVYNQKIDEVTIDGQNIVVVYNNNSVIEVTTNKNIEQVRDEYVSKNQEELTTTISGSTDMGTDAISLEEGFAVIESTYNGSGNFAVVLQDSQGQMLDLLVNEIGSYKGKSFVWVEETGDYYLNINGNQGDWNIKIMQYRPLDVENLPGILKGNGDDVIFFEINQGSYQIALTHNGSSNFVVTVNAVNLLVNEIGNYEGSQRFSFENSSTYVFVVKADGDWTITVKE